MRTLFVSIIGAGAGAVGLMFTNEWFGKHLLKFVPIYNRSVQYHMFNVHYIEKAGFIF